MRTRFYNLHKSRREIYHSIKIYNEWCYGINWVVIDLDEENDEDV